MTRFVLATRNAHKVRELRRILEVANISADLLTLDDFPGIEEVKETGLTFEANALLKARTVADATGVSAIADDSGLSVDVLGGMPGIFSARWSGRHGNDAANLALVLDQLSDVGDQHRTAAFICAAAAARPDGSDIVVRGEVRGTLTRAARGSGGFGYDPIFVPDGQTRTTAEMSAEEKDAISHRGKAFRLLAEQLDRI